MSEFIAGLETQIAKLKDALRPLVAGEAFGFPCNYCLKFDSTLGNPHSIDCPIVIGRKILNPNEHLTLEKRLHKALWAISGSDYLVPRVQQGLYEALHLAYNSGKNSVTDLSLISREDCVEAFIKELQKTNDQT